MSSILLHDYVSLRPHQIRPEMRNRFLDTLYADMERQKNEVPQEEIRGLQVRAKATHSARLTGHFHFYSPAKVRDGSNTFIVPYNKPVLPHHDTKADPLGRVAAASYISTPTSSISRSIIDQAEYNQPHNKQSLKWVRKLTPFLLDKKWEGLGYTEVLMNITQQDAIEKFIDQRYKTLSVGYGTDTLHCSQCLRDWLAEGPCDHDPGVNYGGYPMFLIYGNLTYDEISAVNEPADELAQTTEVTPTIFNFKGQLKDSVSKAKSTFNKRAVVLQAMAADSMVIHDSTRILSINPELLVYDFNKQEYKPTNLHGDSTMDEKLQELINLGSVQLYEKMKEFIPEEKRLTQEQLEQLPADSFAGPNRSFCAVDEQHIEACVKLLESIEDGDGKTEMLTFLTTRQDAFKRAPEPTTESTPTPEPTTTEPAQTQDTETPAVEVPTGQDSNGTTTHGKDYVTYAFKLEGENWGIPDPENPNTEVEKKILDLLAGMYAKKPSDAMDMINKIIEGVEAKDELLSMLHKDANEKIASLQASVDNQRKEYKVLSQLKDSVIEDLNKETKELLIDKITSFGKQDPSKSIDERRAEYQGMSVDELRSSVKVLNKVLSQDSTTQEFANPANSFADSKNVDAKTIAENAKVVYKQLKDTVGKATADEYMSSVQFKLAQLTQLKQA